MADRGIKASCGTDGGYYRHRRTLGEKACKRCKEAHAAAQAGRSPTTSNATDEYDTLELTGGNWVRVGMTWRWRPHPRPHAIPTTSTHYPQGRIHRPFSMSVTRVTVSLGHDTSRPPSGAATPLLEGLADRKDTTDSCAM